MLSVSIGALPSEYTSQDFNSVNGNGLIDFNTMNSSINNTIGVIDPVFIFYNLLNIESAKAIVWK